MKINQIYQNTLLVVTITSFSCTQPEVMTHKLDITGIGEQIGKELGAAGKGSTKDLLTGITEGLGQAAQSKEFGKGMSDFFGGASQQGSAALTDALKDPRLRQNIQEGASAFSENIGIATGNFSEGLTADVFPHLQDISQGAIGSFFNARNAAQFGLPIAFGIALPLAGYYGSKVFWKVLEQRLTTKKPEIIEKEAYPKYGRSDRLKRWWAGYKTPAVIFDAEVKDYLEEIKEKTKNIRKHILGGDKQATYTNLLLYGPPGTGKTLFARVLADYTDMDFLPVSGARLLQSEIAFSEVVDMANKSKYGTIIFIDEADALFIDRDRLMASNAPDALSQYKALNHILGITGQKNNKFMIIAATNNPHVLDEAMDRRFPDSIEMPLPTKSTRLALLNMYINNQLFNEKNNTKAFVTAARNLLTPQTIQDIAETTAGFSHAKLEDMVKAMRDSARATQEGIITQKGINNAIDRAIKKHQNLEKNKAIKAKLFNQPSQPTPVSADE